MGSVAGLSPALQKARTEIGVFSLEHVEAKKISATAIKYIKNNKQLYITALEHVRNQLADQVALLLFQFSLNLPQRFALFLRSYAQSLGLVPDRERMITMPIQFTHERLGEIISATRVTTTLLLKHLSYRGVLEQSKNTLKFPEYFISADFILRELAQRPWFNIRRR
jgi:CRP-like cAMP-binding protein